MTVRSHTSIAVMIIVACSEQGERGELGDPSLADGTSSSAVATNLSSSAGDADDDDDGTSASDPSTTAAADESSGSGDSPDACGTDRGLWPDPDWTIGDPAVHGFDVALLEDAVAYAESNESHCLLVVKDGELVLERYFGEASADTPMKSWSVAK